jgi:EmrB/QacA subfamily drug resistance transporter
MNDATDQRLVSGPPATATRAPGTAALALLCLAQLIVALDYNIVFVALPEIGKALGFNAHTLQWVVSAYVIAFGGLLLLGGRAVDRIGARRMLALGLACYAAGSLAGGLAGDPGMMIAMRAVQGVGGALLTPATLGLIGITYAEGRARNRALAAWGAAGSGGLAAGSLLGGVLTSYLGWEWVFFVNVPLALIALAAAGRLLPRDARPQPGNFDIAGGLIGTASASLIVFALVTGPEQGWGSAGTIAALGGGLALIALFAFAERIVADPLVPPRLLRHRSLVAASVIMFVFQGTLGGAYYLFTTYLQQARGYGALAAGLMFLPLTIVSMTASMRLTPALIGRWGLRATLGGGLTVTGAGIAALAAAMTAHGTLWALAPGLMIWGLGGGTTFPAMFGAAAAGVAPRQQGTASGIANTARQIGQAVGVAAVVAISAAHAAPAAGVAAIGGLRTAGLVAGAATIAAAAAAIGVKGRRHHDAGHAVRGGQEAVGGGPPGQ